MEQEMRHVLPADIERASMEIISEELVQRGVALEEENADIIKRVIHTTADFDYVENLFFTPQAVQRAVDALKTGIPIITDTNMAKAGISKGAVKKLRNEILCFMADPDVAAAAKEQSTTRAVAAIRKAAQGYPHAVLAVGNAPTALLEICGLIEGGLRPELVVGVPVGFVNVVESKLRIVEICHTYDIPCIVAMGRKGGSNVAAAVCNALLYTALGALDPADRQSRMM